MVTKRLVMGMMERVESASNQIKRFGDSVRAGHGTPNGILDEIVTRDLSPLMNDLDYLMDLAE